MYCSSSPFVHAPDISALPPRTIIKAPMSPITNVEIEVTADTPVTVLATFRNRRCTPRAKTSSSRFSTPYAFTIRMPPRVSPSRPVTAALIFPRSRKTGRIREKATAIVTPNRTSTSRMSDVSRQLSQKSHTKAIDAVSSPPARWASPEPTRFRIPSASVMIRDIRTPVCVESK